MTRESVITKASTSKARTGLPFLPKSFGSDSYELAKTDIIVVLQANGSDVMPSGMEASTQK
ncbi:TPA: hypothetical protein H2X24_004350 [Salmonella enterica]|nr:hypothetical protein [Salmonella enterica]HBK1093742.1 hypothetical protein [Salmonella enterica]